MVVGRFAIAVMTRHALFAVNLLGMEVFDPVQGDQVTAFQVDIIVQDLAALRHAEEVFEQGSNLLRADRVEEGPHLRIAGNGVQAKDGAEIVILGSALESKQGTVLETEEGQTGHQGIAQRELATAPRIGHILETAAGKLN